MSDEHIILTSPDGYKISYDIRYGIFLIINCYFNPFNFIDFAEVNINSIPGVMRFKAIEKYDDGTGFLIFQVEPHTDKQLLFKQVENQFNEYFFKDGQLYKDN